MDTVNQGRMIDLALHLIYSPTEYLDHRHFWKKIIHFVEIYPASSVYLADCVAAPAITDYILVFMNNWAIRTLQSVTTNRSEILCQPPPLGPLNNLQRKQPAVSAEHGEAS